MKFADAHIHLSDSEYNSKITEIIEEARQSNVLTMVSSSMDFETSVHNLRLAEQNPRSVYAALGIHPWNIEKLGKDEVEQISSLISQYKTKNDKVVAVGEIGLDPKYGKRRELRDSQVKVFSHMLQSAEKAAFPVIIHSRWSAQRIMNILPSFNLRGVLFHWFSGPVELVPQMIERGYYVSEGPPTVYSNVIREIVLRLPLTNLLTETDGPVHYMGPFKDRPTTPALIPQVVKSVAEMKGMKETDAANQIFRNFLDFFQVGGLS